MCVSINLYMYSTSLGSSIAVVLQCVITSLLQHPIHHDGNHHVNEQRKSKLLLRISLEFMKHMLKFVTVLDVYAESKQKEKKMVVM